MDEKNYGSSRPEAARRDQIMTMEPGQDLDALITEKIFDGKKHRAWSTDVDAAFELMEAIPASRFNGFAVAASLPLAACRAALLSAME